MASSSRTGNFNDRVVVERDPSKRYVRYNKIIGRGATKIVYLGFDEIDGIEIAWSKIKLNLGILENKEYLECLLTEACLLKSLEHDNIVRCYDSWIDEDNKTIQMITELLTSGCLGQYLDNRKLADYKAIKNWARQILQALHYLHTHIPTIIHRDVKCSNIFVNGNMGMVKLGDFGCATVLEQEFCEQKLGTPQFMAPEHMQGKFNHLVDIYSFGMSVLQMVTRELPFQECSNKEQLFRKVMILGEKPALLNKVKDPAVKAFIEQCLAPASDRPNAVDLLGHPFLAPSLGQSSSGTSTAFYSQSLREYVHNQVARLLRKKFELEGSMKDNVLISMTVRITDFESHADVVNFEFSLESDSTQSIVDRMGIQYHLSPLDVTLLSELMEQLIADLKRDPSKSSKRPSDDAARKTPQISNLQDLATILNLSPSNSGQHNQDASWIQIARRVCRCMPWFST